MDPRKGKFLEAVVGFDGAKALSKAIERSQELSTAVIARTIMAWLEVASRADYHGSLPGNDDLYVVIKKSNDNLYGSISVDDNVYCFDNASIYHVAGSVAIALGADHERLDTNLEDQSIIALGKSIDLLVKARAVAEELQKAKGGAGGGAAAGAGPAAAPLGPKGPTPPTATQAKITPAKLPSAKVAGARKPSGKLPRPSSATAGRKVKIVKSQLQSECSVCATRLFKGERFVGCFCFSEMASGVKVLVKGEDVQLELNDLWDDDAAETLVESLKKV